MLFLRYLYLLALTVWLGGMVILGALVAPTTFELLQANDPSAGRALAGALFGTVIARFHYIAYAAGAVLLITLLIMRVLGPRPPAFAARCLISAAMLAIALYSGIVVLGRINAIQAEVGILPSRLPADDRRRVEFDALHARTERLMTAAAVGGLVLMFWEARENR